MRGRITTAAGAVAGGKINTKRREGATEGGVPENERRGRDEQKAGRGRGKAPARGFPFVSSDVNKEF